MKFQAFSRLMFLFQWRLNKINKTYKNKLLFIIILSGCSDVQITCFGIGQVESMTHLNGKEI